MLRLGLMLRLPFVAGFLALFVLTVPAAHAQIYVDKGAPGANDGTSWTDAYTDLQTAIDNASSSSEIWVAEGVYTPDSENDSFTITGAQDGLAIYGGFDGTESTRSARDPDANRTILSGDLAGDDTDPDNDNVIENADPDADGTPENLNGGENAHHVLILDGGDRIGSDVDADVTSATVLDGVTVTGGQADGSFPENHGGGLFCDGQGTGNECSPTLTNVVFRGNAAEFGGGIVNFGSGGTSSPTVTESTIRGNAATGSGSGGAVYNEGDGGGESRPVFQNTTFADNSAGFGGVFYNDGQTGGVSNPEFTDVTFENNTARTSGGVMYNSGDEFGSGNGGDSSPVIENTTFTGNSADFGGVFYNDGSGDDGNGNSTPQITGSTFEDNSAGTSGGVMYNFAGAGTSSPVIENTTFTSNSADFGGVFYNDGTSGISSPQITACTFANNAANSFGGVLFNFVGPDGKSSPIIANTVFTHNTAGSSGGVFSSFTDDDKGVISPRVINSTFTGNAADENGGAFENDASNGGTVTPTITNTILWGNTADADDNGSGSGDEIYNTESGSTPTLSHTILQGGLSGISENNGSSTTDGGEVFDSAPGFNGGSTLAGVDATLRTVDDSVNVTFGSPALDGGDNTALDTTGNGSQDITTDITGAPRVQELDNDDGATVNIGAYETIPGGFSQRLVGTDGTGNDADWRMLSVPAAGANRGDLADDITFSTSSGEMLYRWQGGQWVAQTQDSDALPRGFGFILYVFDDSQDPLTSRGTVLGVQEGGADRTADVTVDAGIQQSEQFEVLGNPYNAAYDLGGLAGGDLPGAGFQATVQVWDPNAQQFKAFTQGFAGDEIPAWNGFILERTSVGSGQSSLTFSASGKQSSSGDLLGSKRAALAAAAKETGSTEAAHAEVGVQMTVTDESGDTLSTDRATLWFDDRASAGWDGYDATDFAPPVSNSYARVTFPIERGGETTRRMLASEPYPEGGQTEVRRPLSVEAVDLSGTATLSWPDSLQAAAPSGWTVRLRDTETGNTVDLRAEKHTFSLGAKRSGAKADGARFRLEVTSAPLPVELARFEGTATDDGVALQWKTASEQNNAGFAVQRQRSEADEWTKVAFVEGNGTTSTPRTYQAEDTGLPYAADTLRYRLRQVDTDGSATLTDPITVSRGGVDELQLLGTYPNPARTRATVRYAIPEGTEAEAVTMRLYDVLGRRVRTVRAKAEPGRYQQPIDVSGLAGGVYFLRLRANGTVKTRKLTVVR